MTTEDVREFYSEIPYPRPLVSPAELAGAADPAFRDSLERRFLKFVSRRRDSFVQRHRLTAIAEQCLDRPMRILDAGCGTGNNTLLLSALFPSSTILAVDVVQANVEHLQQTVSVCGIKNVRVESKDLNSQISDGQFDLILCLGVLHHLPDTRTGLSNLRQCLAPDGTIVLFVYDKWGRAHENLGNRLTALLSRGDRDAIHEIIAKLPLDRHLISELSRSWLTTLHKRPRWKRMMVSLTPPLMLDVLRRAYLTAKTGRVAQTGSFRPASLNSNWDAFAHPLVRDFDVDELYATVESTGLEIRQLWFPGSASDARAWLSSIIDRFDLTHVYLSELSDRDAYSVVECLTMPAMMYANCGHQKPSEVTVK